MQAPKDRTIERLLADAMPRAVTAADEQAELARKAQAGDKKARDRLIIGSTGLVVRIVQPYLHTAREVGLEAADLVTVGLYGPNGDGRSGMARAVDRFNPDRGVRLSSYARYWVLYAVDVALRRAGIVRSPDARPRAARPVVERVTLDEGLTEDPATDGDAEAQLDAARLDARVRDAVTQLPAREAHVIRRRYSIRGADHREIAKELGVSRARVQQIESDALGMLRGALEGEPAPAAAAE